MQELMMGEAGSLFYNNNMSAQVLQVPRSTALYLFEKASIVNPRFADNACGLYTFVPIGRDGEAHFGSFSTPQFNLRPRDKRCSWNPSKCGIEFGIEKIPTCPLQLQNELCTDMLWGSCWEKLLGIGSGVRDFDSTQEAALLLARVINKIMIGIGNDLYYLMAFGGHPYIQMAHEKKWYKLCGISQEKWDCFYEMIMACGGHLTMIDAMKEVDKLPQFQGGYLKASDTNGAIYNGDAMAAIDFVKAQATHEMSTYSKMDRGLNMPAVVGAANPDGKLIVGVTEGIFNRLKQQYRQIYKGIPEGFYLTLYGESHGCEGCGSQRLKGTLMYDDCIVICKTEWSFLDQMTCIKSHRVVLMAEGVLGIAYDVPLTEQYNGMGMEISKWNIQPNKGKTYVDADFRVGAAILDPDYISADCLLLTPKAA